MNPTDYPFFISPLTEEDGGVRCAFPDLPGCISDGETPAEAIGEWVPVELDFHQSKSLMILF